MNPVKDRVDAWAGLLRRLGRRVTATRLAVYEALIQATNHPTADEIYRRVRQRLPSISRATVYNTLETLVADREAGVLLEDSSGPARFDGARERHHHFVCRRCGRIEDVRARELDRLPAPRGVGRVDSHSVTFRGVCRRCDPALRR